MRAGYGTRVDNLQAIAGRLSAGSTGRTEADVQSDVRKFLLDAPLALGGGDLEEILLEAQAGGGKRIDVEVGTAAIEVKKSLSSPTVRAKATEQLQGYVQQRTEELGQRYVGILTDGKVWLLHHLLLDGRLVQAGEFTLTGPSDADALAAWLEGVLATVDQVAPTPKEILRKLGAESPATALDLAELRDLYAASRTDPEVQLKRELWGRLLSAALGANFEDTDELFITHTYLVLTAELIAHAVVGILDDAQDARRLRCGAPRDRKLEDLARQLGPDADASKRARKQRRDAPSSAHHADTYPLTPNSYFAAADQFPRARAGPVSSRMCMPVLARSTT